MRIVILDARTLGDDLNLSMMDGLGQVDVYPMTQPEDLQERMKDADVVVVNKIKLNRDNLPCAKKLKLICVTATGYDNIDVNYCWQNEIGVSNVRGYSSFSVAQLTISMALSLATHLTEYNRYVKEGAYTKSGLQNYLKPTFHEIAGMTWGIVGLGNIGRQVAAAAQAMGAHVLAYKRTEDPDYECVPLNELCRRSDIISLHLPLNEETKHLIHQRRIEMMKPGVIFINVARGEVTDEQALTDAVQSGHLGGLGIDVFSEEPLKGQHCYQQIKDRDNVILTPHMAWGAYEARVRCMEEVAENIRAFFRGEKRNRVD